MWSTKMLTFIFNILNNTIYFNYPSNDNFLNCLFLDTWLLEVSENLFQWVCEIENYDSLQYFTGNR